MNMAPEGFADGDARSVHDELRHRIAALLLDRANQITADAVAVFPFSGGESLDADYCERVGQSIVQLLAIAVRDDRLDPRGSFVADLHGAVRERELGAVHLFTFVYLVERTALDEIALDETIGATSEPWPLVAQFVRRASFDLLGAHTERAQREPGGLMLTDRLTTLYTEALFGTVLAKEADRAGRFGSPLSLILFDVDNLSAINKEYGYGVGDKILERLGILVRGFFRLHDWVTRHSEDAIAVVLSGADAGHANELAESVRATVEERLEFIDHRTERPVRVTLSAGVVNVQVNAGDVIDPDRLVADAEAALDLAKEHGRNRVERVDSYASRSS